MLQLVALVFGGLGALALLAACWPLLHTLVLAWWWRHRAFTQEPEE